MENNSLQTVNPSENTLVNKEANLGSVQNMPAEQSNDILNQNNASAGEPVAISPAQTDIFQAAEVATSTTQGVNVPVSVVEERPVIQTAATTVDTVSTVAAAKAENILKIDANPSTAPSVLTQQESPEASVSDSTKAKVLAALAIVAVAGYIAYWVQEPLQIKADVVSPTLTSEAPNKVAEASGKTESQPVDSVSNPAETPKTQNVDLSLFGFEPAVLKIEKGTTVIWTNTSTEEQTIIGSSPDGESFTSNILKTGDSFSYKFENDSSFEYYSTYNPALKANIMVGTGGTLIPNANEAMNQPLNTDNLANSAPELANTATPMDLNNSGSTSNTTKSPVENTLNNILANEKQVANNLEAMTASSSDLTAANLKAAAAESDSRITASKVTPKKLSQTGPEDFVYVLALGIIAYFNRRKLLAVLGR